MYLKIYFSVLFGCGNCGKLWYNCGKTDRNLMEIH